VTRHRLEAFSDGVIAILITIMVLELSVPKVAEMKGGDTLAALWAEWQIFVSYVLSFVYLAIYWNNHHHMLYVTERITGGILWANMHLLFWLSLVPFATAWMGENDFAPTPTALYGVVLLCAAFAYFILQGAIIRSQGEGSLLAEAVGGDLKGKGSLVLYLVAIPSALVLPLLSYAIYALVAAIWLIPDRRIERALAIREAQKKTARETGQRADE
jgi:uncharacterized membrane protein